ncbi:MAG: hypothetical protein ACRDD1_05545, partial [Planctomycetia bacterium]
PRLVGLLVLAGGAGALCLFVRAWAAGLERTQNQTDLAALRTLRDLERLPVDSDARGRLDALSALFRKYLAEAYGFPAERRVAEEWPTAAPSGCGIEQWETARRLTELLDAARFVAQPPAPMDTALATAELRSFLNAEADQCASKSAASGGG